MADATPALQGLLDHLAEMQQLMVSYLKQDIGDQQFIGEIIEKLRGPAQRERTHLARKAITDR